jgi:hypothetical protein
MSTTYQLPQNEEPLGRLMEAVTTFEKGRTVKVGCDYWAQVDPYDLHTFYAHYTISILPGYNGRECQIFSGPTAAKALADWWETMSAHQTAQPLDGSDDGVIDLCDPAFAPAND